MLQKFEKDKIKVVGAKLYEIRTKQQLSLEYISQKTNISVPILLKIEAGELDYSVEYLWNILEVLKTNPYDFFCLINNA